MTSFLDVDVRPILRAGGEPFSVIMAALESLAPGQGLRLFATFKPVPLFGVMARRGFGHAETELAGGEWEVRFTPAALPAAEAPAMADDWPEPTRSLDTRELDPPEPMIAILETAAQLAPGETLSALLRREPVFLFPELEKRGHHWRGGFAPDGSRYELTVRVRS